jgi:hypothetical protein
MNKRTLQTQTENTMNYCQLQTTLKALRNAGHIPQGFKLNQKREVLQAKFDEVKAIAFSKTITTSAAPTVEPTQAPQATPAVTFTQLIKEFDNYIPAYELAKQLGGLNPKEFWKWAYAASRQGKIELSTLQENFRYTPDQYRYADPSGYFFVSFN